jgi:glycosyltransferase involved in cell wall biosynthesis
MRCPAKVHVAQVGFFTDPLGRAPRELLRAWPTLVDTAEAAARSGARISVIQACSREDTLEQEGVGYHFFPFIDTAHGGALAQALRTLAPDVIHVHGLEFPSQVRALVAQLPGTPVLLQDHASRPPRLWRRAQWRRGFALASGVAFCAAAQALPFTRTRLLGARTRVYEIPESTSRFSPGDRGAARALTGLHGDPALLWVGHLDANKDPLTILEAVGAAAESLSGLQLWCCFGSAPLLASVQRRIATDARLSGRVHLLGRVPHARVQQLMRAADLFVLGSHREGSGYSLIEALACGLPPAVSDIPSFRALTCEGSIGRLWPCGDAGSLRAAIVQLAARSGEGLRQAVRAHFDRELSFDALGRKLAGMYEDVIRNALAVEEPARPAQASH